MICRNCGKELSDSVRFCTGCGAAVTNEPSGSVASAVFVIESPEKKSSSLGDASFVLGLLSLLVMAVPASFAFAGFIPLVHYWSNVFSFLLSPLCWALSTALSLAGLSLGVVSLIKAKKGGHSISFGVWGIVLSAVTLLAALIIPLAAMLSILLLPFMWMIDYIAAIAGAVFVVLVLLYSYIIFLNVFFL
jgi:hypothetical protein